MREQSAKPEHTIRTIADMEGLCMQMAIMFFPGQFPNILPTNVELCVHLDLPDYHALVRALVRELEPAVTKAADRILNMDSKEFIYKSGVGLDLRVMNNSYTQVQADMKTEDKLLESTRQLLNKPPRRPCEFCGKAHLDYACEDQFAYLARVHNAAALTPSDFRTLRYNEKDCNALRNMFGMCEFEILIWQCFQNCLQHNSFTKLTELNDYAVQKHCTLELREAVANGWLVPVKDSEGPPLYMLSPAALQRLYKRFGNYSKTEKLRY